MADWAARALGREACGAMSRRRRTCFFFPVCGCVFWGGGGKGNVCIYVCICKCVCDVMVSRRRVSPPPTHVRA